MEKVRFGIIGCGTVAGYGHIPGIINTPDAELVAISDLNEARLAELKGKHDIADTYTDYYDLLARDDIEAVGIAVPIGSHHKVVMDAAKAGKHVLCEKPIAPTVEEAEEMVRAMADAGKLFAINFELRNSDPHPEMKRLLDEGVIGELKVIRSIGNWMGGRWAGEDRYRMLITEGLGPIVDCGIHHFDLARWYSGSEYAEIHAMGTYIEDWPNPDHVICTSKMENGVLALNENGWAYTHSSAHHGADLRCELIGTDGVISYHDHQCRMPGASDRKELIVWSKDKCFRRDIKAPAKAFDRMYSLLSRSIRAGALDPQLPSGHDGLQALKAALEALRQAR